MLFQNLERFKDWLAVEELSPNTIEHYTYYYLKFSDNFDSLTQKNVDDFLLSKSNKNITARAAIKRMINFHVRYKDVLNLDNETISKLTTIILPRQRGRKKKRFIEPLSIQEIKEVEDAIEKDIYKLGLLVCYYGGLRIGELVNIRVNSFAWEKWRKGLNTLGGKPIIDKDSDFLELTIIGKGNMERTVFLPPELGMRIAKYIKENDYKHYESSVKKLFYTHKKEDPNKPFKVKSLIRNWAENHEGHPEGAQNLSLGHPADQGPRSEV